MLKDTVDLDSELLSINSSLLYAHSLIKKDELGIIVQVPFCVGKAFSDDEALKELALGIKQAVGAQDDSLVEFREWNEPTSSVFPTYDFSQPGRVVRDNSRIFWSGNTVRLKVNPWALNMALGGFVQEEFEQAIKELAGSGWLLEIS